MLCSLFECRLDIIFGFYLHRNSMLFAWQATMIGLVEDAQALLSRIADGCSIHLTLESWIPWMRDQ